MGNKSYGLNYERKEKKLLESYGWTVFRQRGSFSCFDIIAFKDDNWLVESIKSTKQKNYSYKKEIEKLKEIKMPNGTIKRLILYHKGKRKIIYESSGINEIQE